jgi:hypothetical protein
MTTYSNFLTISLLFLLALTSSAQTNSENRSVRGYATVDKVATSISLHWDASATNVTAYNIYRRTLGATSWGAVLVNLGPADSTYTDADVTTTGVYEYSIEKVTDITDPFRSGGAKVRGYSYIAASIEKPAIHNRGVFLVLIAKNIKDSLATSIDILKQDLIADGWEVYSEVVGPIAEVQDVKALIDVKKNNMGCDAVFLLGHIPVPYSGLYCEDSNYPYPPDGHDSADALSHCGAWPADVYYGVIDGAWTDTDSTTLAFRSENNNLIGDGKFDNVRIPGTVDIRVGRADFSRMPLFDGSEIVLTKQYLDKVHTYKTGSTPTVKKGVIENNFAAFDEGFSSAALRDFTAICGKDAIVEDDVLEASETTDYLLSYSCGEGSFTNCNGFGTSADFKTKNAGAFLHVFGSYFGDWDIENNLMRASLCSKKMGLAALWSGRPKWVTHTLALGETYGDIALRTQNNWQDYDANFYQNGTHSTLLGDPSLRHDMMLPAENISLVANFDRSITNIGWNASSEAGINGYYLYRSHKRHRGFIPLNSTPITDLTYIDSMPFDGTNFYMVRAAKVTGTSSGNYENLSLGIVAEINSMKGQMLNVPLTANIHLLVYPTVTTSTLTIEKSTIQLTEYSVINTLGANVMQGNVSGHKQNINVSELQQGIYHITISGNTSTFIKH